MFLIRYKSWDLLGAFMIILCPISKHTRAQSIVWWVFILLKLEPQKTTIAPVQSAQQMSTKEFCFYVHMLTIRQLFSIGFKEPLSEDWVSNNVFCVMPKKA